MSKANAKREPASRLTAWTAAIVALLVACALSSGALGAFGALPAEQAHATSLTAAAKVTNKVITLTANEQKAYNRAVAACMDYENQPNPIVVDISDLGLTATQAGNVWEMIHSNGELFWINCYPDTYTKKKLSMPCYYDDATITKMRKQLDSQVEKALKRVGPDMTAVEKVHMLHDYVLDRVEYADREKTAYTALVNGKGDCYGLTLAMDLVLRRAGFDVDVAFNDSLDHAWNLVRVGSYWFHVDPTWDNGYTGYNYNGNFNWKNKRCHLYLLQSDTMMANETVDYATGAWIQSHNGWRCHHECTNTKYDFSFVKNSVGQYVLNPNHADFDAHCNDWKSIVATDPSGGNSGNDGNGESTKTDDGDTPKTDGSNAAKPVSTFNKGGMTYTVTSTKTVTLTSVPNKAKRAAKKLTVPATVTYKKVTYNVNAIGANAFKSTAAKKLIVKTDKLAKARVTLCLKGSKIKTVKLAGNAVAKKAKYTKCFAKANSGRKASVVA